MNFLKIIESKITENLDDILKLRATRTSKADDSYVTEGDLLVQNIIIETANSLIDDLTIVSEELVDLPSLDAISSGQVLIVDPIDGTENYTSGLPEWGVSLSYFKDGKHQESLLCCPEIQLSLNTGKIVTRHESRIAGISSSLTKEDLLELEPGFEYRIIGCCVLNMINVIRGSFATFQNPRGAKIWDIIGGLNLALEQGLNVTLEGEPYAGQLIDPSGKYRFKITA